MTTLPAYTFVKSSVSTGKSKNKRIAIISMGQKLGDETRGFTRFRFIATQLCKRGYEVDLITSSFQHWYKQERDCSNPAYATHPFNVVFIHEQGYTKNLDLKRIRSHAQAGKHLKHFLEKEDCHYSLIYAQIPPNNIARIAAEFAHKSGIPFVADINDLWPEAMRMVFDLPPLTDILYYPFARDAKKTYELIDAAVGTSDEYSNRPKLDRDAPYKQCTVYVGNHLDSFDEGVQKHSSEIHKDPEEIWVSYAGTLGASYDVSSLIEAAALLKDSFPHLSIQILGDGPERSNLEDLASRLKAPVKFLGYLDHPHMAAYLAASDICVNSLVKDAAQSIVTKIGDYLASESALINTGSSPEFRAKVENDKLGLNVEAQNPEALSKAIAFLISNENKRKSYARNARIIAEKEFDQKTSYLPIFDLIEDLIAQGTSTNASKDGSHA